MALLKRQKSGLAYYAVSMAVPGSGPMVNDFTCIYPSWNMKSVQLLRMMQALFLKRVVRTTLFYLKKIYVRKQ